MAHRHLMAVCVVCLLCADHLPCKEHILGQNKGSIINSVENQESRDDSQFQMKVADIPGNYFYDKRKDRTKDDELMVVVRKRRHADHHEDEHVQHEHEETPEVTKDYIQKIFNKFSSRDEVDSMNIDGFEKMMSTLELKNLMSNRILSDNLTCMSGLDFLEKMTRSEPSKLKKSENEHHNSHHHDHEEQEHDDHHDHHPATESSNLLKKFKESIKIESKHMLSMCPILLYQIVNRLNPLEADGCLNESSFIMVDEHNDDSLIEMEPRSKVWFYSTLSIIGVSLCGLFGVAVIPIMEKHYYHHVLQFLVALAVGTLTGDALLHLLPHSMMPAHKDMTSTELHHSMMQRGLAAVFGIIFFYFFERFLTMVTEWRQSRQKRDKPSSRVRVMRDPESVSLNGTHAACKHKYSSYPYCYDEITMETKDDHHEHQHIEGATETNYHRQHDHAPSDLATPSEGKKNNGLTGDHCNDTDNNTISTSIDDGSIESKSLYNNNKGNAVCILPKKENVPEENYTIILKEHQSKHHGHSHTHGHVHSPPGSLSAVVWMVIMGDGLHNFTDGMAIGAAFSNNIAGGLSTAVAVFCHELPHELGDFAVLLKAGMSARRAVFYNILSSILSFFGMCVGIIIGDTPEASQWIFAVAAGLFIYIALVDMMPELTSSHGKEESCILTQCLLQFLGMCTGFMTMLLIAVYEHDLEGIFAS